MLDLGSAFFPFSPTHGAKTEHVIIEWDFHKKIVAVTSEVANTFPGANASLEASL